jgi:hypothetical protein
LRLVEGMSGALAVFMEWSLILFAVALVLGTLATVARMSVHTQQRLASVNEKDWLVDAFVWINRQLTWRRRADTPK